MVVRSLVLLAILALALAAGRAAYLVRARAGGSPGRQVGDGLVAAVAVTMAGFIGMALVWGGE